MVNIVIKRDINKGHVVAYGTTNTNGYNDATILPNPDPNNFKVIKQYYKLIIKRRRLRATSHQK